MKKKSMTLTEIMRNRSLARKVKSQFYKEYRLSERKSLCEKCKREKCIGKVCKCEVCSRKRMVIICPAFTA
jgi:hypothetical protein